MVKKTIKKAFDENDYKNSIFQLTNAVKWALSDPTSYICQPHREIMVSELRNIQKFNEKTLDKKLKGKKSK